MGQTSYERFKEGCIQTQGITVALAEDCDQQVERPKDEAQNSRCRREMEHAGEGRRSKIQVYGPVSCSCEMASINTQSQPSRYDLTHPGDGPRVGCPQA